jgi:polar amino acid transport system permease protein
VTSATSADPTLSRRPEAIRAVAVRHPGRWVAGAVVLLVAAMMVNSALTNKRFGWGEQAKYAFSAQILDGVRITLVLTFASMLIGVLLGVVLAVMRLSPNPLVSRAAWLYIWVFRGTPVLVQLIIWANLGALFPQLSIGIPFGPAFAQGETSRIVPMLVAVLLGLGLNEGAYMAEIVRAGILSVDEGQTEAAAALGMSRMATLRRIVLPQAMRVIVPPTGNETISMLKTTSLAAYVPFYELLFKTQNIYTRTYEVMPMLIMASLWYLAMTSVLMVGQYYIERHYARGATRNLPDTPLQKLRQRMARA